MVPYADLANHAFANNATFCLSKDNRRCARRGNCLLALVRVVSHLRNAARAS